MHAYKTLLLLPRNGSSSYLFLFFFKAVNKLYRQYGNEVETLIQDGKEKKKTKEKS